MTDMIEKMARAIQAAHANYENRMVWHWDEVTEPWKSIYLQMAKAALSALEDPSAAMVEAGANLPGAFQGTGARYAKVRETWNAMIKAAKGEE
jgi:hypothetical protein